MLQALKFEVSQQVIRGARRGSMDRSAGRGLLMDTGGVSSSLKALPKVGHSPSILHKTDPHSPTLIHFPSCYFSSRRPDQIPGS